MTASRILVVDDEADIRSTVEEILTDEGFEVTVAADAVQARAARAKADPDLILLDIWMPETDGITLLREWSKEGSLRCPVVMMSGHGTVETAVEATRLGAYDFVEKPLSLNKLLRTVERALEAGRRRRKDQRHLGGGLPAPVGKSRVIAQLREQLQQVAPHASPVLLQGESGSGREAFARYLHSLGRSEQAFVAVVGGLLDDAGAVRALRGTVEQPGLYAQATGGTLFINSIDDLSATAQRVIAADIEAGQYVPEGGSARRLDVRWVASALPGVEQRVGESPGALRRDLHSALAVVVLRVPPLRDYAEDVPELLRHYVDRLVDEEALPFRRFGVAAQNRLRNYPFPGNISELRNFVHRLLVLGGEEEIRLEDIERELAVAAAQNEPLVKQDLLALPLREAREAFERAYLQQQLLLCNGKVGQLAKRVGMERTHLYRKLRSLGVDFRQGADD
jgi:DNA-binding NtrC family response regulator